MLTEWTKPFLRTAVCFDQVSPRDMDGFLDRFNKSIYSSHVSECAYYAHRVFNITQFFVIKSLVLLHRMIIKVDTD